MPDDQMARDHARDYAYKGRLFDARMALEELLTDERLPAELFDDIDRLRRRLLREANYITEVWD